MFYMLFAHHCQPVCLLVLSCVLQATNQAANGKPGRSIRLQYLVGWLSDGKSCEKFGTLQLYVMCHSVYNKEPHCQPIEQRRRLPPAQTEMAKSNANSGMFWGNDGEAIDECCAQHKGKENLCC